MMIRVGPFAVDITVKDKYLDEEYTTDFLNLVSLAMISGSGSEDIPQSIRSDLQKYGQEIYRTLVEKNYYEQLGK